MRMSSGRDWVRLRDFKIIKVMLCPQLGAFHQPQAAASARDARRTSARTRRASGCDRVCRQSRSRHSRCRGQRRQPSGQMRSFIHCEPAAQSEQHRLQRLAAALPIRSNLFVEFLRLGILRLQALVKNPQFGRAHNPSPTTLVSCCDRTAARSSPAVPWGPHRWRASREPSYLLAVHRNRRRARRCA
jgi:hypothetical protein